MNRKSKTAIRDVKLHVTYLYVILHVIVTHNTVILYFILQYFKMCPLAAVAALHPTIYNTESRYILPHGYNLERRNYRNW